MNCLEPEEALAALDGADRSDHCPACAGMVADMGRVRILARRVGSECWAPLPQIDVEVALRRVRARVAGAAPPARAVLVVPAPSSQRTGSGPRVPQVLSAAAAALLLCALVGPYALRQRVERPAGGGFNPGQEGAIFWTSAPQDLALTQLVGAGR